MTPVILALLVALGSIFYLLPSILAGVRGHVSAWGIFALNMLLGWSGIVWIIALIWALSNKGQPNQQTVIVNTHVDQGQQPAQPIYVPVPQAVPAAPLIIASPESPLLEGDTKACPSCAETIKAAATKCRFCGEQLSPRPLLNNPEA